jgi:hypothetical protein
MRPHYGSSSPKLSRNSRPANGRVLRITTQSPAYAAISTAPRVADRAVAVAIPGIGIMAKQGEVPEEQESPLPACPVCGARPWAAGAWQEFFQGQKCAAMDDKDTTFCRRTYLCDARRRRTEQRDKHRVRRVTE